MKKILLITFYDTICYGTRQIAKLISECGLEPHLIILKKDKHSPLLRRKQQYKTYQYYYNGLMRGSHYAIDPITIKEKNILFNLIEEISPSMIGISTRTFAYDICKELFPEIRNKFINIPIVAGGWGPTLEPEKFLEFSDYVCFGEGEETIINICNAINTNSAFDEINNLIYYKNNSLKRNEVAPVIDVKRLNQLPFADFSVKNKYLISDNVLKKGSEFYNSKIFDCFSARGCPMNCSYCLSSKYEHIYKKYSGVICPKYRLWDIDRFFAEIKQAKQLGAEFIRIKDEVFPFNKEWIEEFIERYPNEIGLPFFAYLRPEFHNLDTVRRLKAIGLTFTMLGIQSGCEEIRKKIYQRNLSKKEIIEFAKMLEALNIEFNYHFICQNPFEKECHLEESLNFTYELPLKPAFIFELEPHPGSPIKDMIEKAKPVSISENIQSWYAMLHAMSLQNIWLRKISKSIHRYKIFKNIPVALIVFFLPSLINEFFKYIKNIYFLNLKTSYFSYKKKKDKNEK